MTIGRKPKHSCPKCKSGATGIISRNRTTGVDKVRCRDCGAVFTKHPMGTAVTEQRENVAGRIEIGRGYVWGAGF